MRKRSLGIVLVSVVIAACSGTGTGPPTSTERPASTLAAEKTIHIESLLGSSVNLGNTWTPKVVVSVADSADQPVAGAMVEASWNQGDEKDSTCQTNSDGGCIMTGSPIHKNIKDATLTVSNIEHTGSTYLTADNIDADPTTECTNIRVSKY